MENKNYGDSENHIKIRKIHKTLFELKFEETGEKFSGTLDEVLRKLDDSTIPYQIEVVKKYCVKVPFQRFLEIFRKSNIGFIVLDDIETNCSIFQHQDKMFICEKSDKTRFIKAIQDAIIYPQKRIKEFNTENIFGKNIKLSLPVSKPEYLPQEYIFYRRKENKQDNKTIESNIENKVINNQTNKDKKSTKNYSYKSIYKPLPN